MSTQQPPPSEHEPNARPPQASRETPAAFAAAAPIPHTHSSRLRRPLTHIAAAAAWALAGILSVLTPFLAVTILNSQYQKMRKLVLLADPGLIEGYIDQTELTVTEFTSGPFQVVATLFLVWCVLMLLVYAAVVWGVLVGSNAARIVGTALVVLATPILLSTAMLGAWIAGLFGWVDISALAFVNFSFPLIMLLHLVGAVCVWLPPTNRYVRARREYRERRRLLARDRHSQR